MENKHILKFHFVQVEELGKIEIKHIIVISQRTKQSKTNGWRRIIPPNAINLPDSERNFYQMK